MVLFSEEEVFQVARRIDEPDARRLYLDQVCGSDAARRARLDALLRAHDQEQSFLERPAAVVPTAAAPPPCGGTATHHPAGDDTPGTVIGPYKLLQQLGEGGMGTVWMAEQAYPVQRKVAVKLIK